MLELLTERRSLWERLREAEKPIYLYGMGDGAVKIMDVLTARQIPLAGIFASDEFVRGHCFAGYPVQRYREIQERHGKAFIVLLAFAINYEPMLSVLSRMDTECEFYAPDVPVVKSDGRIFDLDYLSEHAGEFTQVWEQLSDEQSQRVFLGTLNYKVSGKISYLNQITTEKEAVWKEQLCPDGKESYLDLGAYNGDTIEEYLQHTGGRYGKILAMEPDPKNYAKLQRNLNEKGISAECYNLGAWAQADTLYFKGGKGGRNPLLSREGTLPVAVDAVDRILDGRRTDLLKMDVEGAELQAIHGASETISRYHPKLVISAYHRNEDLFALPLQILKYHPGYRLYLRHHPYIPAWDTNYYCIP